jgi:hypothetical protein
VSLQCCELIDFLTALNSEMGNTGGVSFNPVHVYSVAIIILQSNVELTGLSFP